MTKAGTPPSRKGEDSQCSRAIRIALKVKGPWGTPTNVSIVKLGLSTPCKGKRGVDYARSDLFKADRELLSACHVEEEDIVTTLEALIATPARVEHTALR